MYCQYLVVFSFAVDQFSFYASTFYAKYLVVFSIQFSLAQKS
jgi:hypothetical protein